MGLLEAIQYNKLHYIFASFCFLNKHTMFIFLDIPFPLTDIGRNADRESQ